MADRLQAVIKNVNASYDGSKLVLKNINFSWHKGEKIAILGSSGSGKTSLLRLLGVNIAHYSGELLIDKKSLLKTKISEESFEADKELINAFSLNRRNLQIYRQNIALVLQKDYLLDSLSVLENVLLGAINKVAWWRAIFSLYPSPIYGRAMKVLEDLGLRAYINTRASSLSGGEQQRVALARALVQEAELILADEPLAHLDDATKHTVLASLIKASDEQNITLIMNLHDPSFVQKYFDRVVGIKDGEIVYDVPVAFWTLEEGKVLYEK